MHASHQLVSTVLGQDGAAPESHLQVAYPQDAVTKEQAGKTHQEPRRDRVNQFTTCQTEQLGKFSSTIRWISYKNKAEKRRTLAQVSLNIRTTAV